MSEVALPQNPAGTLAAPVAPIGGALDSLPQTAAVIQLAEWAAELTAAHKIALALASSSFLPMGLRTKSKGVFKNFEELTNDAAAVILAGKSVGLDPMQSVQNIFPVHGMPSMYARTMAALVIAQGHEVRRTVAVNEAVTYVVRRKGDKDWQEFTWTIERARKAGYTSNKKYQEDPIAMLGAKALAEGCRVVFPDILLGMAYSTEELELEDMGEVQAPAASAPAAAPKAKVAVKRRQAPAPELPAVVHNAPVDPVEPEPEPVDGPEMMSAEQWTHLSAALMGAGYKTKAAMGTAIEEQLNRATGGPDDITAQEASDLLAFFTPDVGPPAALDDDAKAADAAWLAGAK